MEMYNVTSIGVWQCRRNLSKQTLVYIAHPCPTCRFGEEQPQPPPPRPPLPPVPRPPVLGEYHQTEAGYHQTSGTDQSLLYPTLSTELQRIEQEKPQKVGHCCGLFGMETEFFHKIEQ